MLRRFIVMILLLPLMGCSAIELHQQTTKATPDADVALVASMQAEQAQLQATNTSALLSRDCCRGNSCRAGSDRDRCLRDKRN